jgi:hypothetical protein
MNPPQRRLNRRLVTTAIFGVIWLAAIGLGLRTLLSYESTPGAVGAVPSAWPHGSKIPAPDKQDVLVVVVHPHCSCSDASMEELAKIMARVQGKLSAYVLFLKPTDAPSTWEKTELRRSAEKIPGVTVLSDVDGTEARMFGAETSGHAFLYDRHGRLLFNGGITLARGHSGDNSGESAIIALVNNQRADRAKTFVFGCSLVDRGRTKTDKAHCLK